MTAWREPWRRALPYVVGAVASLLAVAPMWVVHGLVSLSVPGPGTEPVFPETAGLSVPSDDEPIRATLDLEAGQATYLWSPREQGLPRCEATDADGDEVVQQLPLRPAFFSAGAYGTYVPVSEFTAPTSRAEIRCEAHGIFLVVAERPGLLAVATLWWPVVFPLSALVLAAALAARAWVLVRRG